MVRASWRWVIVVVCLLAAPLGVVHTGRAAGPVPRQSLTTVASYCADGEEQAFLGLINQYRASNGLGTLDHSRTLAAAAEHHSVDMATVGYFSHTMSDGTSVAQNMANHGVSDTGTWGENIAAGNASASATFQQWRNSPGHNANMLKAGFGAIGIGRATVSGSQYGTYWTTIFGGASDGPAANCGAAPAVPAPSQPVPGTTGANATVSVALNLRAAPSLGAAVLAVMPAGSRVAVTGAASGGFLPVRFGTTNGWASASYLALDGGSGSAPTPQPTPPPTANLGSATVTSALNLRAGAGVTYAVLAVMPAGSTVTVRGAAQGGFLPVRYGGVDGWAAADYLSTPGSTPAPAPTPALTPAPGAGGGTLRTTADLNLRASPSLGGAVLLVMPPGATVTDLGGQQAGFRQVRYGSVSGWASATYLAVSGTNGGAGTTSRTAVDDLNLRAGPGTGEAVLLVIPAGGAVAVTGPASGEWLPVRYAGVVGWAFAAYLT